MTCFGDIMLATFFVQHRCHPCFRADNLNSYLNEIKKDTFEIPLTCGLRNRAGRNGWWFGRTVNASYITFV